MELDLKIDVDAHCDSDYATLKEEIDKASTEELERKTYIFVNKENLTKSEIRKLIYKKLKKSKAFIKKAMGFILFTTGVTALTIGYLLFKGIAQLF